MVALNPYPLPTVSPVVEAYAPRGPVSKDRSKRVFDFVVALGLMSIALPVIAALWLLVRATSVGPGFYSQTRVGRGGRNYRIYKIRTMRHNCEGGRAQWATKSDSRATPVGRVLRKLHLDELPQLWNVLRGDMSLVGPRPERPEFVSLLTTEVEGYTERLRVRPGVTGLAQIQLPADSDTESVQRKVVLDRYYVENMGFWLDVRILLGTVIYLIGFTYAQVRRLMRLPNPLGVSPIPLPRPTTSTVSPIRVPVPQPVSPPSRVVENTSVTAASKSSLTCSK